MGETAQIDFSQRARATRDLRSLNTATGFDNCTTWAHTCLGACSRMVLQTQIAKPGVANQVLAEALDRRTTAGTLCRNENGRIRCLVCGHRCLLADGRRGICKVRFNRGGELRVPFGYVAGGLASDPVEKKPFFHVYPGSDALTFGMLGCDFHCGYCQNWVTSQSLRDEAAGARIVELTPQQIIAAANRNGARLVVSSYNEPLITAEWAVAVFQAAKSAGLACAFVSNGNATSEVLDFLKPWIVAYKIDLKGFDDRKYRALGGTLEHVCNGIRMVHERRLWLEIVTLIVPGFNDGENELRAIAKFVASINRDIPWHVTAFHPDYKMTKNPSTSVRQLIRTAEIGMEEGLRYVYAGNAPGQVGDWENTYCPECHKLLIERTGYFIRGYHLTNESKCPKCHTSIPGIWRRDTDIAGRNRDSRMAYQLRMPHRVSA